MKAVLKYPGAKNRIAPWIIKHIPEHKVYCEPFFGSGAVLFNKEPCYNEIVNDIDDDVYNFFKVLRTEPSKLAEAIRLTPYSRTEYEMAYISDTIDDVERARIFAIKCWQGFGCGNKYKNGFRRGIGATSPNPAKAWNELFYPQLGVKLCSMAGGGVQKIYMVLLREPSRRDRSGSDLFHLRDGFEIKMNFDRNVSCFILVNALMHDDFFD